MFSQNSEISRLAAELEAIVKLTGFADILFKRFSANFYGKISPVHFFWGSFDLAVTRFDGKKAPPRADPIQSEAYSHEVISAGFCPGNGGYGRAAFYARAAPNSAGSGIGCPFGQRRL